MVKLVEEVESDVNGEIRPDEADLAAQRALRRANDCHPRRGATGPVPQLGLTYGEIRRIYTYVYGEISGKGEIGEIGGNGGIGAISGKGEIRRKW